MHAVDELQCMNNDLMLIDAVVELPHVIVTSPGIGDNCSARQHMLRNNAFQCACITLCYHLKPATTTAALNQTNDPFTTTVSPTVVFAVEEVALIGLHEN